MARRRVNFLKGVVLLVLPMAVPLAAQTTNNVAATTPTPSPAPAGNVVGPPQLRDFNLNGTVTQPAQPPATAPTTPAPGRATPVPRATPTPAPPAASRSTAPVVAPDLDPAPDAATVALPPPTTAPIVTDPSSAPGSPQVPVDNAPLARAEPTTNWWPWLAALIAIALGAGFWWWRRQQHSEQRYAAGGDIGSLVATPAAAPAPLPRAAHSAPARVPVRQPVATPPAAPAPPPPAPPIPDGIIASRLKPHIEFELVPVRQPVATPPAASAPPPAPPIPDGIIASRLKPHIEFELVPIRAETDVAEGAALTVDIIVINRGSAPARDVLIEAQLINAGPQVDAEVGRFFMRSGGDGERVPMIPPMGRVSIQTRLTVPGADLAPLVVEGRKLLVPLIAINALYRWSGGELKDSSSFLIGRGDAEGGKMAPFRLDRGARSWSGLAARLHSSGLQR